MESTSTTPRDLEKEFEALDSKVKELDPLQNITPVLEKFATLLIDTLQAESDRSKWTEMSKKFPLRVRLFAMSPTNQKIRESFMRRLGIPGRAVSRWYACLYLEHEDRELAKLTPVGTASWRVQKGKVDKALKNCETLMLAELRENPPRSVNELRQALDATHDYALQLRMLDKPLERVHKDLIRSLFNEKTFFRFKRGVRLGVLQDKVTVREGKGLDTSEIRGEYEQLLRILADGLRLRLLRWDEELLPDSILEEYPASVRRRVIGEQQGLLREQIEERIRTGARTKRFLHPDMVDDRFEASDISSQLKYLRSKTAEIKDELGEPDEARVSVRLLMNLRRMLWRNRKKRYAAACLQNLLITNIRELPVRIIMTAVRVAEWNNKESAGLLDLVLSMPNNAYVRTLNREIDQMIRVAPDRYYEEMVELRVFLKQEFKRFMRYKRMERRRGGV